MFRNVYTVGLLIFAVIMTAFFITNIFFRDVDYYRNSITLNAFFVPLVFAVGAYFSVSSYSRWKKYLTFKEAYGRAFIPMFTGGLLTVASIFVYITYVDTDTKDLLNYQYIDSYKRSLEKEYSDAKQMIKPESVEMDELIAKYEEAKVRIAAKESKNEDMFTLKYFGYVFAGYCVYFLLLSLFFGSFYRTRISEMPDTEQTSNS